MNVEPNRESRVPRLSDGQDLFQVRHFLFKELFYPQTEGIVTASVKSSTREPDRNCLGFFIGAHKFCLAVGKFVKFGIEANNRFPYCLPEGHLHPVVRIFPAFQHMDKRLVIVEKFVVRQFFNDRTAPTVRAKELPRGHLPLEKCVSAQVARVFIRYPHISSLCSFQTPVSPSTTIVYTYSAHCQYRALGPSVKRIPPVSF